MGHRMISTRIYGWITRWRSCLVASFSMVFVSLTRLRVRSVRFMPLFVWHALRSNRQVRRAQGFLHGALLPDRDRTFWTMTAWESQEAMRGYMTTGGHKKAMPHLMKWCDEASVAHWEQENASLLSWEEADRRMRTTGRASKVRNPSAAHAGLSYREPRTSRAAAIRRR
jgi:heme-degrading monooxygenase HmoA